jgi:hypothetical protein
MKAIEQRLEINRGVSQYRRWFMATSRNYVKFEGINCTLVLRRPKPGIVLAVFKGHDVGEYGDAPFRELATDLEQHGQIDLFVDGRDTFAASMDVSGNWAAWMREHKDQIRRLDLLCGSRFLHVTAEFVRKFSGFEDRMRIYTEAAAFEKELALAVNPGSPRTDQD